MPAPSAKSPSWQTNVSLDKKSDSTITNTVTEHPLQMPLEKKSVAKSFETLTTLPSFQSPDKEEFISPNLRVSKSESTFYNQASVETLYVSPSFKTFNPVKEILSSKDFQKPTQSSVIQLDEENLKSVTTWGESVHTYTHTHPSFEAFICSFSVLSGPVFGSPHPVVLKCTCQSEGLLRWENIPFIKDPRGTSSTRGSKCLAEVQVLSDSNAEQIRKN